MRAAIALACAAALGAAPAAAAASPEGVRVRLSFSTRAGEPSCPGETYRASTGVALVTLAARSGWRAADIGSPLAWLSFRPGPRFLLFGASFVLESADGGLLQVLVNGNDPSRFSCTRFLRPRRAGGKLVFRVRWEARDPNYTGTYYSGCGSLALSSLGGGRYREEIALGRGACPSRG